MMRELLDLRGELGELRDEQSRGEASGNMVVEVEETIGTKMGRQTGGRSTSFPLRYRPRAPPQGRCGRAAAADGPLSITFHPGLEEDVHSVYNEQGSCVISDRVASNSHSHPYSIDYVPGDDRCGTIRAYHPAHFPTSDSTVGRGDGTLAIIGHMDAFGGRRPYSAVPMRHRLRLT